MCKFNVGIISEGPTDQIIIRRIIGEEFQEHNIIFYNISPTEDEIDKQNKKEGFGWGSVYKICKNLNKKLEIQIALGVRLDLLVIHIDGDVMMMSYESSNITQEPTDDVLPSYNPKLSIADNCKILKNVVKSWNSVIYDNFVYCIPYINSDIWIAYALYENNRILLEENTSKEELDQILLQGHKKEIKLIRLKEGKIRKNTHNYKLASESITKDLLKQMKNHFSQLDLFCSDISSILK